MNDIETISAAEAAKALHLTHACLKAAIRNGDLPVGFVFTPDGSTQDRVIVVKSRWDAYFGADDIKNAKVKRAFAR